MPYDVKATPLALFPSGFSASFSSYTTSGYQLASGVLTPTSPTDSVAYFGTLLPNQNTAWARNISVRVQMNVVEGSGIYTGANGYYLAMTKGIVFCIGKDQVTGGLTYSLRRHGGRATYKNQIYAESPVMTTPGTADIFTLSETINGWHVYSSELDRVVVSLTMDNSRSTVSTDNTYNYNNSGYNCFGFFSSKPTAAFNSIDIKEGAVWGDIMPGEQDRSGNYGFYPLVEYKDSDATSPVTHYTTKWTGALGANMGFPSAELQSIGSSFYYPMDQQRVIFNCLSYNGSSLNKFDTTNFSAGQAYDFRIAPAVAGQKFSINTGTFGRLIFNDTVNSAYCPVRYEQYGSYDSKTGVTTPSTFYNAPIGMHGSPLAVNPVNIMYLSIKPTYPTYNAIGGIPQTNANIWSLSYKRVVDTNYTFVSNLASYLGNAPLQELSPSTPTVTITPMGSNLVFHYLRSGWQPNDLGTSPSRSIAGVSGEHFKGDQLNSLTTGVMYTGKRNEGVGEAA